MACGCKKKRRDEAERIAKAAQPKTINGVVITEGQGDRPPDVLQPPAEEIVDKLNQILKP